MSSVPEPLQPRAPDLPGNLPGSLPGQQGPSGGITNVIPFHNVSIRLSQRQFKLHEAHFGDQNDEAIEKWLHEMLRIYIDKHKRRFQTELPKWDRLYEGRPLQEKKSFPWPECVSLDTDVLTDRGWKPIGNIEIGEHVYSMDMSGNADFYPVTATTRHPAENFVHFLGKSIDLLVTTNHQLIVEKWCGRLAFHPADYYLEKLHANDAIPLVSHHDRMSAVMTHGLPTRAYLRLLGWYLSEGWAFKSSKSSFGISQSRTANPEKYEILRSDIEQCGIQYSERENGFILSAATMPASLADEFHSLGVHDQKFIPRHALRACEDDLRELLDTLLLGDGWTRKRVGHNKQDSYSTTSWQLANDVQELCQYVGLRGTISVRPSRENRGIIRGRCVGRSKIAYAVSINKKTHVVMDKLHREAVKQPQEVACVTVEPHHTIYVRRNGKAAWIGNCSNLVIQIIGQETDDLAARVVNLLYATSPLAIYRYVARTSDPGAAADKARVLEQFMDFVGYEPDELDLYPKYSRWFSEGAKYGTGWVKAIPEHRVEATIVGYDDQKKKTQMETSDLYHGPKVKNRRLDAVMMDPEADTVEDSQLVTDKSSLSRAEMEERVAAGFYTEEAWEKIRGQPDRHGQDATREKELREQGLQPSHGDEPTAEWDIYECWFWWLGPGDGGKDKVKYRLIEWYHYETRTCMKRVFNFMPQNSCAIVRARLSTGDKGAYGRGYCEMLEHAQDEISTTHNQSADATTAGILGINRVDLGSNLDRHIQIYPFATVPLRKDAFEHIPIGNPAMAQIAAQREELMLQLVHERSGVGPAVAGMGAGGMQGRGKSAQYTAMGTLSVMQDSNSRVNHRASDFRLSHVKLLSLLTKMYGTMGYGKPGSMFGLDDRLLAEALEDFVGGRIRIPIRGASASANKEVEKQTFMMLSPHLAAHHKNVIQMLQALQNPGIPPDVQQFFRAVVKSENRLEKQVLRAFGFDQPDEFVPEPQEVPSGGQQNAPPGAGGPAGAAGPMADPRAAILQSLLARRLGGMAGAGGGVGPAAPTAVGSPLGNEPAAPGAGS